MKEQKCYSISGNVPGFMEQTWSCAHESNHSDH